MVAKLFADESGGIGFDRVHQLGWSDGRSGGDEEMAVIGFAVGLKKLAV